MATGLLIRSLPAQSFIRPDGETAAVPGWRGGIMHWAFDDTTVQMIESHSIQMPDDYDGGGCTVSIQWINIGTDFTGDCDWEIQFERQNSGSFDVDSRGHAGWQAFSGAASPASAGLTEIDTLAVTDGANMDSVAAGEVFNIRIRRNSPDGIGSSSDCCILHVQLEET